MAEIARVGSILSTSLQAISPLPRSSPPRRSSPNVPLCRSARHAAVGLRAFGAAGAASLTGDDANEVASILRARQQVAVMPG